MERTTGQPGSSSWLDRPRVFGVLLLALGASVSAWYADRGLPFPDEGAQLTAAARLMRGALWFRDVDAYPWPGAAALLAGAMQLFGEHLSVARFLAGALYCITLLALYLIALQLLERRRAAIFGLGLLSLKFLGWPAFSAYFYADLAFCCACLTTLLLLGSKRAGFSRRLVIAGLCAGLAVTAKQNLGLYLSAACGGLLAFPRLVGGVAPSWPLRARAILAFGLGAAVPLGAMSAWFTGHGLFGAMLKSGLERPLAHYLPTSGISFGTMLCWWELGELRGVVAHPYLPTDYAQLLALSRLPGSALEQFWGFLGELFGRVLYTSVPVAFAWALARRLRGSVHGRDTERETRIGTLALLALAVFASCLPRADLVHVVSVIAPVLLLLLALRRRSEWAWRAEAVAVALLLAGCAALALHHRSFYTLRLELERASVDVEPDSSWIVPIVAEIEREIPPGEPFFVLGHEAQLYFLSARYPPWPFAQLYPGQTGDDGGRRLSQRLEREPPRLVVLGILRWPGVPDIANYAPVLMQFVASHYVVDATFFQLHPPPAGEPPPAWLVRLFRLRP